MTVHDRQSLGLAIGGMCALAASMGIGRFAYTPILPFMVGELDLSAQESGYIASANFFGYLVGALAGAARQLPGSTRSWFLAALALSALTSAAMAATTLVPAFFLIRFASGMASAFVFVFSTTLVLNRLAAADRYGLSAVHFPELVSALPCRRSLSRQRQACRRTGAYCGLPARSRPRFFWRPLLS